MKRGIFRGLYGDMSGNDTLQESESIVVGILISQDKNCPHWQ